MKRYAISDKESFYGVYDGDTVEQAVYDFLESVGIRGFHYAHESNQIEAYFAFCSRPHKGSLDETLKEFKESTDFILELFKESDEIAEGRMVYVNPEAECRVLFLEPEDSAAILEAVGLGYELVG